MHWKSDLKGSHMKHRSARATHTHVAMTLSVPAYLAALIASENADLPVNVHRRDLQRELQVHCPISTFESYVLTFSHSSGCPIATDWVFCIRLTSVLGITLRSAWNHSPWSSAWSTPKCQLHSLPLRHIFGSSVWCRYVLLTLTLWGHRRHERQASQLSGRQISTIHFPTP